MYVYVVVIKSLKGELENPRVFKNEVDATRCLVETEGAVLSCKVKVE